MTFTASALVLAWVAIVLLALGLAGLLRQVSLLTRQLESGSPAGPLQGGRRGRTSSRGARTARELVGFTLPREVTDRVVHAEVGRTVVAFVSPGCSSCTATLRALAHDPQVADGHVGLSLVSTGSCEPSLADAVGAARLTCTPQGRDLMDRLAVPATPYLLVVEGEGLLAAALLPDEGTDLGGWLRQASAPGQLTSTSPAPTPKESPR